MIPISILVCSYNTPKVLKTCLKSWKRYNIEHDCQWLISENSTNNETSEMLDKYSIPYFRNIGMRHADGVDFLIRQCKTEYALLIDSDVVFRKNIQPLWDMIKDIKFIIAGERCGDRGGKLLYPRINPWFCFLNTKIIQEKNFQFGDDTILNVGKKPTERIWDVGSKLYDEAIKNHFPILDMEKDMESFYYHYEGMSWRKQDPVYSQVGLAVEHAYQKEIENHSHIDLNNDYLTTLGLKYGTDKATDHGFLKSYHEAFKNIRFDIKSVLEIGVWKGESINMWLEYFPNAIISCVDIDDKTHLFRGNNRVKFYRICQSNFIPNEQYDIIIDDGSHRMADQQQTFKNLYDKCNKIYIIEDLHTSVLPLGRNYGFDGTNSTIDFLKSNKTINLELIYTNRGESISSIIRKVDNGNLFQDKR